MPDLPGLVDALKALRDGTSLATLVGRALGSDEFTVGSLTAPSTSWEVDQMFLAVYGTPPGLAVTSQSLPVTEYAALLLLTAERNAPDSDQETVGLIPVRHSHRFRFKSILSRHPVSAVDELIRSIEKQSTNGVCDFERLGNDPADADFPLKDLLLAFESLGDNCEFGLVQRAGGAEPLGLLRFAAIYQPFEQKLERLVTALDCGFEGLGAPGTITFSLFGDPGEREYFVQETVYSLRYHSGVYEGEAPESELEQREVRRLAFLRRKLLEDLATGEKIWVWKCSATTSVDQVEPLLSALRRLGPNVLLWVVEAGPEHPPGSVERLGPDLLQGYAERFAPYEVATAIAPDSWFRLCRSAYRLVHSNHPRVPMDISTTKEDGHVRARP